MKFLTLNNILSFTVGLAFAACDGSGSTVTPTDDASLDTTTVLDSGSDTTTQKDTAVDEDTRAADTTPDLPIVDVGPDLPPQPTIPRLVVGEANGTLTTYNIAADGALTVSDTNTDAPGLQFGAFTRDNRFAYAVGQNALVAFAVSNSGVLTEIDSVDLGDRGTHLEVDETGQFVFIAFYGGDRVLSYRLENDGTFGDVVFDRGPVQDANYCQRAHQARVHPSNNFVYIPCLVSDHIAILAPDADAGTVTMLPPAAIPEGGGPRHMDFHPTLDVAYVINETASTVSVFDLNTADGSLTPIQRITSLPDGITAGSASSDIHVTPDGLFVYAVNRQNLHNIAIFSVAADGQLTLVGHQPGSGEHSRSFELDRDANRLYLGNANTQNLVVFDRDATTGLLTETDNIMGFGARIMYVDVRYYFE